MARPLQVRNKVLASICPQLHGLFLAKLAVALMLIGGVPRLDEANGTRTRGELHMLLVGDPGTGAPPACALLEATGEPISRPAKWIAVRKNGGNRPLRCVQRPLALGLDLRLVFAAMLMLGGPCTGDPSAS